MTSSVAITARALPSDRNIAAHETDMPASASRATIIFRLLALSARMPPSGDRRMAGIVATDNIPANMAAEPVASSIYMDKASFSIKFPNKDVSCPRIRSVKFFENNFSVTAHSPLFSLRLSISLSAGAWSQEASVTAVINFSVKDAVSSS